MSSKSPTGPPRESDEERLDHIPALTRRRRFISARRADGLPIAARDGGTEARPRRRHRGRLPSVSFRRLHRDATVRGGESLLAGGGAEDDQGLQGADRGG